MMRMMVPSDILDFLILNQQRSPTTPLNVIGRCWFQCCVGVIGRTLASWGHMIARRLIVAVNPRRFGENDSITFTTYRMRRARRLINPPRFLPRRMTAIVASDVHDEARRLRVAAALLAAAVRSAAGRLADAWPPSRPPFCDEAWDSGRPRPEPLFFPPPLSLFTVAQAMRSASFSGTPLDS